MKENPYVRKNGDELVITPVGMNYLKNILSDPAGPVYVFNKNADPVMVAGAMARLSRRGSDLREIFLDEFANVDEKDKDAIIKRVVTGYGDDSVQQLACLQFVVEDASNLMTKLLEWGRFAGYLEQSTRYIYFDQANKNGNFKYFTPRNLAPKISEKYKNTMNLIFLTYSQMVHKLTDFIRTKSEEPKDKKERIAWLGATRAQACDAVRPVLPVATKSTVGIVAVAQSVESLILHLASENLLEAQDTAKKILIEARKVIPAFLERADLPERGGAWIAYRKNNKEAVGALAKKYLGDFYVSSDAVILLDCWPENEIEIVPEILFESAKIPLRMIKNRVENWSLEQKMEVLAAYIGNRLNRRHKPGRAFEKIHYEWQITADYGTFRDLQRHRVVDSMEWQRLTTIYGYEVPQPIKEAGLENEFKNCFEYSDELNQSMIEYGFEEEAQYATLLGHKMRYRFLLNARESFHFLELRTSPQGHPGYRKLCQEMHKQLCKVHPLIGNAMKFVNQGEDPELTRLASELATQKKLSLLEKE